MVAEGSKIFMVYNVTRVGNTQSAYIKGRQIIDGPLIVNELISWSKKHISKLMIFKFADDVLFVGEWSEGNVKSLVRILRCYQLFSGLKVNLSKSCIYGQLIMVAGNLSSKLGWKYTIRAFISLKLLVVRLFTLETSQECCLSDRCGSDDDNFQWKWDWREDDCNFLLSNMNLFYVKSVRATIDTCGLLSTGRPTRWPSLIPSKVLIFVWRAERNRIPTRVELDLKEKGYQVVPLDKTGKVFEEGENGPTVEQRTIVVCTSQINFPQSMQHVLKRFLHRLLFGEVSESASPKPTSIS
uniref:RNA-directed DNA polymerase, eukaryota, reverse transcriptase zinc-binding domain protein n=1 Tax=Tanacetum cinerariifolium TaxID=118510 RepID=A0A699GL94_TANCI|nr:RNA-directed DNA polymerase, eukaryota, reverse transcriptase zinc-binding domain protein [Tanacetum cinerariifolium]